MPISRSPVVTANQWVVVMGLNGGRLSLGQRLTPNPFLAETGAVDASDKAEFVSTDEGLARRVTAVTRRPVRSLKNAESVGGYTEARRMIVTFEDESTAFVKAAVDERTLAWLPIERRAYESLGSRGYLPELLGADDGLIILEDLSGARWPPPWSAGDFEAVLRALDDVARSPIPEGTPHLEDLAGDLVLQWEGILAEPAPLLALGVCSGDWLRDAGPALLRSQASGQLGGSSLVHGDVRSDNLCFIDGRVVLIDWPGIAVGSAEFDRVYFAATVAGELGVPAIALVGGDVAGLVVMMAGYFAAQAVGPEPTAASRVRDLQRRHVAVLLAWAAELLDLPSPA